MVKHPNFYVNERCLATLSKHVFIKRTILGFFTWSSKFLSTRNHTRRFPPCIYACHALIEQLRTFLI